MIMSPRLTPPSHAAIRKPIDVANRLVRACLPVGLAAAAFALAILPARAQTSAQKHDLFLCATINKDYVIGSKLITLSGLYRRDDTGNYTHFGSNFPQIFSISFDPRDQNFFYITNINGCMQTADGGKTWRTGTSWDMTEGKDVCVDPNAPDNVYLALPDGIAVSNDRGATWVRQERGLPARGKYTQTIKVDRTKAGRVLAGCESGIYLTENGAKTWKRVLPAKATVTELQQSPHDAKVWIASTQNDGVFISRNGGSAWKRVAGLETERSWYSITFDPTNPQRLATGGWAYGLRTSEDGGETWVDRSAGLADPNHVFKVSVDPDNGRLYANLFRNGLFVSDDFGRTWRRDGLEGASIYTFAYRSKAAK